MLLFGYHKGLEFTREASGSCSIVRRGKLLTGADATCEVRDVGWVRVKSQVKSKKSQGESVDGQGVISNELLVVNNCEWVNE